MAAYKILFVDDEEDILSAYKINFRRKFDIDIASSADAALEKIKQGTMYAVIFSDYNMPKKDGLVFLSEVKALSPVTVRILITGYADLNTAIRSVNEGNLFRFLTKPADTQEIQSAIMDALELHKLMTAEKELLDQTLTGTINILVDLLSLMNPSAFGHIGNLKLWARKLGKRLQLENLWELEVSAMLSQIGCVTISADILEKKYAGKELTASENTLYKTHPETGQYFLRNIPRLQDVANALPYQFHPYNKPWENDPSIVGEKIPLLGRFLKVLIDFDLYTTASHNDIKEAFASMERNAAHYDPNILAALECEVNDIDAQHILTSKAISELESGMHLMENIVNNFGTVLIGKNQMLSEIHIQKLKGLSSTIDTAAFVKVSVRANN